MRLKPIAQPKRFRLYRGEVERPYSVEMLGADKWATKRACWLEAPSFTNPRRGQVYAIGGQLDEGPTDMRTIGPTRICFIPDSYGHYFSVDRGEWIFYDNPPYIEHGVR